MTTESIPLLLWTLASVFGLFLSLFMVNESRLDVASVRGESNGRLLSARSRLIRESVRVLVHGGYLHAALIAAFDVWPGRWLIVWILVFGNLALVFNTYTDYRLRPHVWEYRRSDDKKGGEGDTHGIRQ